MNKYILEPVFSNKSSLLEKIDKYVMIVNLKSNKNSLKKEIGQMFRLNIAKINVIRASRRKIIFKNRSGFTGNLKKIILTVER